MNKRPPLSRNAFSVASEGVIGPGYELPVNHTMFLNASVKFNGSFPSAARSHVLNAIVFAVSAVLYAPWTFGALSSLSTSSVSTATAIVVIDALPLTPAATDVAVTDPVFLAPFAAFAGTATLTQTLVESPGWIVAVV